MKQFEKVLDKQVFERWKVSQDAFNTFLDTLDHIEVSFVDRNLFEEKKADSHLIEETREKYWKDILYLPKDLKIWELLWLVNILTQKFGLEAFSNVDKLLWYTKITLAQALKYYTLDANTWKKIDKKSVIKSLKKIAKEKYWIHDTLIDKIQHSTNDELSETLFEQDRANTPEILRWVNNIPDLSDSYTEYENTRWKIFQQSPLWLPETLWIELERQFDNTFLKRWVQMLRQELGMFTMKDFIQLCKDHGIYDEVFDENWKFKIGIDKDKISKLFKKKWKYITIRNLDLDNTINEKIEKKLRKEIAIEKYKTQLSRLRNDLKKEKDTQKKWEIQKEVDKLELEASNKILQALHKFPYQDLWTSYQPSTIKATKQMQCVWFSLVGHALLSELGIKHKWIHELWHIALLVEIWEKKYIFDATVKDNNRLLKYKIIKWSWLYQWIETEKNFEKTTIYDWYVWEVENLINLSMYINRWVDLADLWNEESNLDPKKKEIYYKQAIEYYNKAIELNPKYPIVYYNKWIALSCLWNNETNQKEKELYYHQALECYDKAIQLNPKYFSAYNNKWVIYSNFLTNKVLSTANFFTAYILWKEDWLYKCKRNGYNYIKHNPQKMRALKQEFIKIWKGIEPDNNEDWLRKKFEEEVIYT